MPPMHIPSKVPGIGRKIKLNWEWQVALEFSASLIQLLERCFIAMVCKQSFFNIVFWEENPAGLGCWSPSSKSHEGTRLTRGPGEVSAL